MAKVVRQGDKDTGGGVALQGVQSVRVNNRPVVVNAQPVSGHGLPPHSSPRTVASKNQTVRANGILIVVSTDKDTCGHIRGQGSPNVNIG